MQDKQRPPPFRTQCSHRFVSLGRTVDRIVYPDGKFKESAILKLKCVRCHYQKELEWKETPGIEEEPSFELEPI